MTELDELERDLLQAADTWFNQALHQKLQRLIQIARSGEPCVGAVKPNYTTPIGREHTELRDALRGNEKQNYLNVGALIG